jgi:hypothetical protein
MIDKVEFLIELSESTKTQFGKVDFSEQQFHQKVFSAIWYLDGELNNGGFEQYFSNPSGETAPFVELALREIGAKNLLKIWNRAVLVAFPYGMPHSPTEIFTVANELTSVQLEKLDIIDQEFYSYPDVLANLLYDFVTLHSKEFTEPATVVTVLSNWKKLKSILGFQKK